MRLVRVLRAMFACAIFSAIVTAQSDVGSLSGFVRDPSSAVVPKAKVVIRNEATMRNTLLRPTTQVTIP